MELETFTFSASSIKEYLQCGEKFRLGRIIKAEPAPINSHYRWFGTLIHHSLYSSIADQQEDGSWVLRGDMSKERAEKRLEELWNSSSMEQNFVVGQLSGSKSASLEEQWYQVAQTYLDTGLKIIEFIFPNIISVEQRLDFTVLGQKFVGYIDLLASVDDQLVFYDFKTSWRKPDTKINEDLQFFLYSAALKQTRGLDYYPVGYYVHLRSGGMFPGNINQDIEQINLKSISSAFDALQHDLFFADRGGRFCKFCDFRYHCFPEWRQEESLEIGANEG